MRSSTPAKKFLKMSANAKPIATVIKPSVAMRSPSRSVGNTSSAASSNPATHTPIPAAFSASTRNEKLLTARDMTARTERRASLARPLVAMRTSTAMTSAGTRRTALLISVTASRCNWSVTAPHDPGSTTATFTATE